jgi:peptidyl-prolyl cis-trans isomerase A (cyclophilin A)
MRKYFSVALALVLFLSAAFAQNAAQKQAPGARPKAVIETSEGKITCELFPDKAPKTVENFIGLASGTKEWKHPMTRATKKGVSLYDGTIFHRVIPNFMIQAGDPMGNGTGNPGYSFQDEFSKDLKFDRPGRLAMANSGPNTNGSQFFITEVPVPHLNDKHTIFGQCENMDIVKKIARVPRDQRDDRPFKPVRLVHINIIQPGQTGATVTMTPADAGSQKK